MIPIASARDAEERYELFKSTRKFASLDGLRCLCILAVIWHHTARDRFAFTELDSRGFLGVDMFFVLSGFLIVTLLLREREKTGTIALGRFYARRALRIFPLYYGVILALTLGVLIGGRGGETHDTLLHDLPYLLTYTGNWHPLLSTLAVAWSLAAEEQFYLLWPPIERWLGHSRRLVFLGGFIGVNQLLNFRVLDRFSKSTLSLPRMDMVECTFTPICLGVLLAHVLNERESFAVVGRALSSRLCAPVMLLLLLVLASLGGDISGWARLAIQLCMTAFVGACVVREDHVFAKPLNWPFIARLGAISYGMYLLHKLALHGALVAERRLHVTDQLFRFAVCLALTIVLAELSFRFYETPFLKLKGKFENAR